MKKYFYRVALLTSLLTVYKLPTRTEEKITMNVTKAVIPAAGLGTRFLPITKSIPKEMLPLLNKPAIHYIINEGLGSAINQFIMIISKDKQALIDYLSPHPELETMLKKKNKFNLLDDLPTMIQNINVMPIEQKEPLGLGHAILLAEPAINNEYFGVFLPDDIVASDQPCLGELIAIAQQHKANVIAVQEVPADQISAYGVISIKEQLTDTVYEVADVVEKPKSEEAPSNLAIVGRYVFSPHIFDSLRVIKPSANGELQLTDAITDIIQRGEKVLAYKIKGPRYDIGTPRGWLHANIDLGLRDENLAQQIKQSAGK